MDPKGRLTTLVDDPSGTAGQATLGRTRTLVVGISGARQNAAASAAVSGRLVAFCEQERMKRVRSVGLEVGRRF